jgi:hypothetical protein
MNRIKHLWLAVALAFGCGASQDAAELDGEDFGQEEQAIIIGTNGHGFSTADSHLACAQPGVSGQDCRIPQLPPSLQISYCFTGFTAADKADLKNAIVSLDSQVSSSYQFVEVTGSVCTLSFLAGVTGAAGTTNIESFVKFTPTGTVTTLSSPSGAGHVNGTWKSFTLGNVGVDTAKLTATYSATDRSWALFHIAMSAGSLMLGEGRSTAASSPTRRAMAPVATLFSLTPGEVCRINVLNGNVSPTTVSALSSCPP